jgi:hypothetical protein
MSSNSLMSNLKYYGKFIAIIVIIFLLLKFIMSLKLYEALLLSLIITVSILIIENLIYINDIASDPLNCDQCKVNLVEINQDNITNTDIINNIVPNPLAKIQAEMEQTEVKEPFISDSLEKIINNISDTINKNSSNSSSDSSNSNKLSQLVNDDRNNVFELKCIKTNKNIEPEHKQDEIYNQSNQSEQSNQSNQLNQLEELKKKIEELQQNQQNQKNQQNLQNNNMVESFGNLDTFELEQFISNQQNQNKNMVNKLKSQPKIQATINKIKNKQKNTISSNDETLENPYLSRADLLNKPEQLDEINSKPKLNPDAEYNLNSPITYDAGYVQYQQDGLQKQENDVSFNNQLFKMGIGQENIVKPFMKDGSDYYNRIQSYSSKAPTPQQALNSELRYGDYNYIGPLNSGMTNSDYTFVSPNNWYPVPPHPPVCVTNKQCTTCPIMISDGQDYMNWATLADFDKARRFTGNMGINIDYVKNVLNNDEGY